MFDKKIEREINSLFLKKDYQALVRFSEEKTIPYKRPSSVTNLIGISIMFQKNLSERDIKHALDLFQETYLGDIKGPHGLNGLFHLITIVIQFHRKYKNLSHYLILSEKYYLDAEKNFVQNENLLKAGFLLFKYLLNHSKLKEIISTILNSEIKSKILKSWCLINNNYFYDWSQKDHYNQTKLNSKYFTKLKTQNIKKINFKNRKIKVGFVSAHFELNHSTTFFLKNTVKYLDKNKFETYAFSFAKKRPDDLSQKELKNSIDYWFDIQNLDNQQAVDLIQQKQVDILIDLMGYTVPHRIEIFYSRVSPIQISWLAYCNTLGFETVDYLISDPNLIFEDEEKHYSEKILRMPNIWNAHSGFTFERKNNTLPSKNSKLFKFGSFNNFNKVSEETIKTWSKILKESKNFRLVLKSSEFCDPVKLINRFKENGVENQLEILDRSNFKNKQDHIDLYKNIDLALDTFPYNGVTTTFEALWMNVPVLVLKGYNFNSRCGESIIKNSKLNYFLCSKKQEYVEKAIYLANNKDKLDEYRNTLFKNVLSTPLFDTKEFSKNFGNLLLNLA